MGEDMKVASEMLGENVFMFGDEPSLLDLVVYSQMAQVYFVANEQPCSLRDYMESECTNLVGLVNRMKDLCWGDDKEKSDKETTEEAKEEKNEEKKTDVAKEEN